MYVKDIINCFFCVYTKQKSMFTGERHLYIPTPKRPWVVFAPV